MQDYNQAIETYERSLLRYPDSLHNGDLYLGLCYCYTKLGNTAKADYYKKLLIAEFPDSHAAKVISDPGALDPNKKDPVVTQHYKDIYSLFIEGKFDEAIDAKTKADSLYGTNYWSPQLLYIEAVYYIKECNDDSSAIKVLTQLTKLYATSSMKPKAERLIDVLNRRKEIEGYLTKLKITRAKDSDIVVTPGIYTQKQGKVVIKTLKTDSSTTDSNKVADSNKIVKTITPAVITKDSIKNIVAAIPDSFDMVTDSNHVNVMMILNKVDPTYIGEARNALNRYNDENFYGQTLTTTRQLLDSVNSLLVISSFSDIGAAIDYYNRIKRAAPDEISWLPANKYSFLIITDNNLKILAIKKDLAAYKILLNKQYPGKF